VIYARRPEGNVSTTVVADTVDVERGIDTNSKAVDSDGANSTPGGMVDGSSSSAGPVSGLEEIATSPTPGSDFGSEPSGLTAEVCFSLLRPRHI
jgi:hypothetical protein